MKNSHARATNTHQEPGAPSWEEVSSATDVVLAVVKATKGLRIYLPNNPVLIKFVEELATKLEGHIQRYGDFKLDVEPFVLRYKGAAIYENPDPKESLAFRVHSDGIRVVSFARGIEQRELKVFLGIVAFEQPGQQDDDIVTQLWERNLPHITYLLEEDFVEVDWQEDEPEIPSQQDAISALFAAVVHNPPPLPRPIPKQFLAVTRDEAAWLRKLRQSELSRSYLNDVFQILFSILAGTREIALFGDFIDIAGRLTVNMFMVGEVGHALQLVRFLDQLMKRGGLTEEQRSRVAGALGAILNESTVHVLQEAIDTGETVSHEELRELLLTLGLRSLAAICELLGRVEKLKMRKVIIEVLVELGKDRPEVFAPFLNDIRWYLVRNVVLVLSLLGTPTALKMIVGLIAHKEQRIRKEVLGFLERSPDPKAKPYIVRYLRDESSLLRIKALQILAREKPHFALKPVLALVSADDFKGKDLEEKKTIYEALGEIGDEKMLPLFRDLLLKKRWFKRSIQKEDAICAVAGLLRIGTPAAVELLEEARGQRNPETRAVIEEAIASIKAAKGAASEEQYGAEQSSS
jgi:hypothetical protein